MEPFIITGALIDSEEDWSLRILENGFLVVDRSGKIVSRGNNIGNNVRDAKNRFSVADDMVINLDPKEFLMPGLIDCHIHAAQFPNAGLGLDLPLLSWLEKYTYPTEIQFADPHFARRVYSQVVETTLASGTTAATYYATIHRETTEILCDEAIDRGQRALVGKVCMNRNGFNGYVERSARDSIHETRLFASSVLQRKSPLVSPIITPRWAGSCDNELLQGLADLSIQLGGSSRIQTHLAETRPEVAFVRELEPAATSYTDIYDRTGLLTPRTILAHCIYLDKTELALLRDTGSGVAHCPNSNCSIRSGNMDVRKLVNAGIKVGLGTDCSAGYSVSMIDAMRHAILVSNQLSIQDEKYKQPLTFSDAIYLATRGSASVTSLGDVVGALEVGKRFDALRIRMGPRTNLNTVLFGHESMVDLVHKFVFLGDDRNVVQVWVDGRLVKDVLGDG